MTSNPVTLFFIFTAVLTAILLAINFILAPHKPYKEKKTPFECGFHSFVYQNRKQFSVIFFIYSILFLIFDLELFFAFPLAVSISINDALGILTLVIFFLILTLGFVFELGGNALNLDTKQVKSEFNINNFLTKLSLAILLVNFSVFKYIFKTIANCTENQIYTAFAICFLASIISCILYICRHYYKNSFKFNMSVLVSKFTFTFAFTSTISILAHSNMININLEPWVDIAVVILGIVNGTLSPIIGFIPITLSISPSNSQLDPQDRQPSPPTPPTPPPTPNPPTPPTNTHAFQHSLNDSIFSNSLDSNTCYMSRGPGSSGPQSNDNQWEYNNSGSMDNGSNSSDNSSGGGLNSADIIDQISDTGFIDERHLELAKKVQDPERGTSLEDYERDVTNLRNHVDRQDLGEYQGHWRRRDDEFISESRAAFLEEDSRENNE